MLDYPVTLETKLSKTCKDCPMCEWKGNLDFVAILEGIEGPYSTRVCRGCIENLLTVESWESIHKPVVGQQLYVYLCPDGRYVDKAPKKVTAVKRMIRIDAVDGYRITSFTDISWPESV